MFPTCQVCFAGVSVLLQDDDGAGGVAIFETEKRRSGCQNGAGR
jgi:hypothetical protein